MGMLIDPGWNTDDHVCARANSRTSERSHDHRNSCSVRVWAMWWFPKRIHRTTRTAESMCTFWKSPHKYCVCKWVRWFPKHSHCKMCIFLKITSSWRFGWIRFDIWWQRSGQIESAGNWMVRCYKNTHSCPKCRNFLTRTQTDKFGKA